MPWFWATVYPDICSAQTLWKPPRKRVGIYIYIPNHTAGSVETQQSLQATREKGSKRERKGEGPHTVLFLLV